MKSGLPEETTQNIQNDHIVGVLAYEINICHPTDNPLDDFHGNFTTHAMFALNSKRIAIVGAYSTDDRRPIPKNEWIQCNIVTGSCVKDVVQHAKYLVKRYKRDPDRVCAGWYMPWEEWRGTVIMYFADQDFQFGETRKIPNPFRRTNVDAVGRTLLRLKQEWQRDRVRAWEILGLLPA